MSVKIFFLCMFFSLIAIFTYALTTYSGLRSATISQKEFELRSVASDLSASLSPFGTPALSDSTDSPDIKRRIIITDSVFRIKYDSSSIDNLVGKILLIPAIRSSLHGETSFECVFLPDGIESYVSIPIIYNGNVSGALLVLESDLSFRYIFDATNLSLILSSLAILILFFLIALLVSTLLNRKISNLHAKIKETAMEFGSKKIKTSENNELTPVIEEINNIYEHLNYVQQMRQAFVSDASHELRTPLAATKLLCESITSTQNIDPETTREFMNDILLEVDRMSHTAEKLLVLSQLDNSVLTNLAPVPLTEIVKNSLTSLYLIAANKNITIESYLEENCNVLADMEGANQIVSNLIDNAIKYNFVGGTLRVYLYSKNEWCIFIVDDTGIGIAPENRERVFERFFRVDKSRGHDGRGGSGLGLAIVKRNIETFGGDIKISDSVFGGARFTVKLRRLITEEEKR